MSGVELRSLDGGENIEIPKEKCTIGRGTLLKVTDTRVSRNHATLEVNPEGKLILTPIHTNPCFYRKADGAGKQCTLPKDKPFTLQHGDKFGLLPEKLFFEVVYLDMRNGDAKDEETDEEGAMKIDLDAEKTSAKEEMEEENGKDEKQEDEETKEDKEMALPLDKKRKLPDWMVEGATAKKGPGPKTKGQLKSVFEHQILSKGNIDTVTVILTKGDNRRL
ncbi:aprataxin and PNK-like factor [Lingula anatina]|uniref:Aprataxin and PNK-like factor n=1 Tax=Lingula anatina TaxID=7574 RepID=A0A2R2MJJ2_LINAN|nr:aprataxin and PNK-like factor [Lingula anatina]|eukprot:XP_023930369.1 aprataxin and PNK-like factor [Lingula anatina]